MNSIPVDKTEVRSDRQSDAAHEWGSTPVLEKIVSEQMVRDDISDSLKYGSVFVNQNSDERTPLYAEHEAIVKVNEFSLNDDDIETSNPFGDISEDRITLLARKYVTKKMVPEDAARLNILTQKLRNVMPGITERDIEIIESIKSKIDSANELNDRIKKKYKL